MGIKVCCTFSDAEAAEGANVCELLATRHSLQILLPFLTGLSMDHRVDNSGVAMALGGLIPASAAPRPFPAAYLCFRRPPVPFPPPISASAAPRPFPAAISRL